MRGYWIVIILATLVALGLVMVVQSQYQMEDIMNKKTEALTVALEELSNEYLSQDSLKVSVEKVWQKSQKAAEELDAEINKINAEMERKKAENDACQGEMKTAKEELADAQKTHEETKIVLEAEIETWNQEIKTLKVTLTQNSPVCDYVKKDAKAEKLCNNTVSTSKFTD